MIEAVIFDFGRTLYDPTIKALFPGVIDTLTELQNRNLKLGLVSIAETDDTDQRLKELNELGIMQFFSAISIIARSIKSKNFGKIFDELGVSENPRKAIIIGDNLKRDIEEGNSIGAHTVWTRQRLSADWKPINDKQNPDYTIEAIEELIPIIEGLLSNTEFS
ncbi:HAD hydrolase-like protein [Candidatus Roizmanbacteria bacterium]|nr:HAD hydrolase-like protein [Candidatus Roizmanbacteria bacterium]